MRPLVQGPRIPEGVTDYWMLSSISDYLRDIGRTSLHEDLTITPAGGAQKINYMVALLASEQLRVLALLDEEPRARETKDDIVKAKLIREQNVMFVSEAFEDSPSPQADIEDLLDSDVYISLVKESYSQELKGKSLNLNANIPRISKHVEAAFKGLTIEFHKTRPTRLLLKKMASKPESILTQNSQQRFEKIFSAINERLERNLARKDLPFG
jgi:hypothetical protein